MYKNIIAFLAIFLAVSFLAVSSMNHSALAALYQVNPKKSILEWEASKVGGKHNGTIAVTSGSLEWEKDTISKAIFEIDMDSIVVLDVTDKEKNEDLVKHLKSDDFFSSKDFSTGLFKLTSLKKKKGNEYEASGDLTFKNIQKPISFPVTLISEGDSLQIKGKAKLDRTQWGIRYKSSKYFPEIKNKLIHDDFYVTIKLEAEKSSASSSKN